MTSHWRLRPSTLRSLAVWLRLVMLTTIALVAFVLVVGVIHGVATSWE